MSIDTQSSNDAAYVDREDKISIVDVLLVLARSRDRILKITVGCALLGFVYVIAVPSEYTASSKVIREVGERGLGLPPSLASLSGGLGVDLGAMGNEGLSPDAVPEILASREVRLAVARDTFYVPEHVQQMTLVEYVNDSQSIASLVLDYAVKLPFTLYQFARADEQHTASVARADSSVVYMSEEEVRTLEWVAEQVNSSVDAQNGIMSIYVRAGSPDLAVAVMRSVIEHLTSRVREIQTTKTRANLIYIRERFEEAEQELRAEENRLADFLESNQGRTTQSLKFQEARLQRQVRFAEQIYSNLQEQLTRAKLTLERQKPVLTTVEAPSFPEKPTSPRRVLIIVVCIIIGGLIGVSVAIVGALMKTLDTDENANKIDEIRSAFHPGSVWRRAKEGLPWK